MSLGNYDNNNKKEYMPVYYSEYNTGNPEGIDPSALSYSFYNRMLKISISPLKANNGDKIQYDHENAASIWLTHTKARIFYGEIQKVLNGEIVNGGVPSGKEGLIRFCDGKEFGVNGYCLVINKINENGEVVSSYVYQFKSNHHYAVQNFDPNNNSSHKKCYYDTLEVQQLLTILEQYYISMSGAPAYSVLDAFRYNTNASNTKMDLVMSKLGIDYKPGTSSRSSSYGGSYFDNKEGIPSDTRGGNMRTATMEDLE